jgi:hypothetical protein
MALGRPPRHLSALTLQTIAVTPAKLFRLSRHDTGEPFFGRRAANRFDDPSVPPRRRFGTCYFGLSLVVAIAETVLHDEMPNAGVFHVAAQEFESRFLVKFTGENLVLADLTGVALKALAGDGSMSTVMPYTLPQLWCRAIHRHQQKVDGMVYMSRHVNDEKAVVLFDRAARKLQTPKYRLLPEVPGAARAANALRIKFSYV